MEILNLDIGLKEYRLTENGVLRFNPSDPNVYSRFLDAEAAIRAVEKEMSEKANGANVGSEDAGALAIRIMSETDAKMKNILNGIYGHGNDFHAILEGVNLMAVGNNGHRIIDNLLNVLTPIMEQGAKDFANDEISAAKLNREQRRAMH